MAALDESYARLQQTLWESDLSHLRPLVRAFIWIGRLLDGIVRQFNDRRLDLYVMGLAYSTLLSLVPFLAVSFSVLKAFGAQQQLEPLLEEFLQPLGAQAGEIQARILGFVNNLQVGVLGSVGFVVLFYTAVSLVFKTEQTFNAVWHVDEHRSLSHGFSYYLSIILIGPVLIFSALGLANSALESEVARQFDLLQPVGSLLPRLHSLGSYLLISLSFAFLYGFLPNTRVGVKPALAGGLLAGLLWVAVGRLFTGFIASSTQYSAVYSGFAGAILFVLWLQVSWLIVVVGCQICAYLQHPRLILPCPPMPLPDARCQERLALAIMALVGCAHLHRRPLPTLDTMQQRLQPLPVAWVAAITAQLEAKGLLAATRVEPSAYLPARAVETIPLAEVLAAVRNPQVVADLDLTPVTATLAELDDTLSQHLAGRTVRDLVPGSNLLL
jgi:membrane protein